MSRRYFVFVNRNSDNCSRIGSMLNQILTMGIESGFTSYNFDIKSKNYGKYYLFRYFPSLERLESFLNKGIYLTRADKFSDNLECVNYEVLSQIEKWKHYESLRPEHNVHLTDEELTDLKKIAALKLDEIASKINRDQKKYHVSCWYISQHETENELMWRSYGVNHKKNSKGFLVKFSLKDFMDNLARVQLLNKQLENIVYGSVAYYDFNNPANIQKVKYTGFRKHFSFKDESEFRLIYKNNSNEIIDDLFLKLPKDFYHDISIIAHPDYELQEYQEIRDYIEEHYSESVQLSGLYIWYKLKDRLKSRKQLW